MIVETYPIALKKFMKFTKMKSVTLAEYIGYDVSYISKWINGAKLPSSRAIERVNEDAAALFAETIEKLDRRQDCCRYFSVSRRYARPGLCHQRLSEPGLPHVAPERAHGKGQKVLACPHRHEPSEGSPHF